MTTVTEQESEMNVLKSKITELQTALFYTESVSPVKLPTHVITDVEVDIEGRIWFAVPRPTMHIDAFEKEVLAKLDFFKKGKDFFVKVKGVATLLTDAATINSYEAVSADMREKMSDEKSIGIMVKIEDTEFVDNTPKPSQNWLQSSRSQLSSWFF
jgi:general stress protein 26